MNRLPSIAREPLVHFLLIGAGLFLLNEVLTSPAVLPRVQATTASAQVIVSQDDIDQLNGQFERIWRRPPTEAEQEALTDDFVRSEILYREALALGLDRGDPEIRRRLRQRIEFLYEDVSGWSEPSDQDLVAFMGAHPGKYIADSRITFRQVFVNASKRGAAAESVARELLTQLRTGAKPDEMGDPTMLEGEMSRATRAEIARQFGEVFTAQLFAAPPGAWTGPVPSAYGLHLVMVTARVDGEAPPLRDIRATVQRDWTIDQQNWMKDESYAKIRQRYDVKIERRTP